ncbi:hypothetical protein [Acidovorax sp.]|uniref:hypothetical protein n=1 Tax=Acidovorax sp. TaxID=1872122 RepID=UPI00391BFA9C
MGTSSTALFSDDVACDIRDEFIEMFSTGADPAEVTEALIRSWSESIQDVDDGPVFWLALAATQWKYGCLDEEVRNRAVEVIDCDLDIKRWEGSSIARRRTVLLLLRKKLFSPQPAFRRPHRRKPVVVPSNKVASPDGRALATAYELGKSPHPDAPRMQVFVEMEASGSKGGGGVFVATCEFKEVSLTWIDTETLQIAYPESAILSEKKASLFYFGRTIKLAYAPQAIQQIAPADGFAAR